MDGVFQYGVPGCLKRILSQVVFNVFVIIFNINNISKFLTTKPVIANILDI